MKYKLILLFFLLASCSNYSSNINKKFGYSASGFAFIDKNIPTSLKNNMYSASHNKLRNGTKIKITNPANKKSIEVKINKKVKYDNFYKISISDNIATQLDLSFEFPYIEINEIKKNKSYVAKKAITDNAEKKIANKAPIDQININNISKKKKRVKKKVSSYSILVADFYSVNSAELLKERLTILLKNSNYNLIYINKKNDKKYELLMGPYNTINKLKNDYIVLNDSNFEDLDIKINE